MVHGFLALAALVASAWLAGLYFAFSCSVLPGLRRVADGTFVEAVSSINASIRNPLFALAFFGAPVLTAGAAPAALAAERPGAAVAHAAAFVLHAGALVVTVARNLPLNDALDAAATDPVPARAGFEGPWRRWNAVRAVLTTAAVACLGAGLAAG
ncbi:anthrone oxygenase family protein [Kineococcus arenarius]|uniref:anthrone oxygenase family protein n=1 Tax=unclassified Kineococcus TaxID=2621656 RepID=UPI003D7EAFD2